MELLNLPRQIMVRAIIASGLLLLILACMSVFAQKASAHGYVDAPSSRAILCKNNVNSDCGAIIYEPQSLEATKGFPGAGPADGKIASANGAFPKLDEQSSSRWSKVAMSSGTKTFTWKFTANHKTTSFRYFITKATWNPDAPLTRSQFDLVPFCTVDYGAQQPPSTLSHDCNVPSRSGYHIILAVWDVADTANAFYNVIDANFSGGPVDNQAPTAPTGLSASNIGTTTATLSWSSSTDNVGVTGYKIYSGSNHLTTVPASSLQHTLTGLTSSTHYVFTVKAVDAAGNESAASNAVNVTTGTIPVDNSPPTAPPGLHIMGTPTSSTVHLMWSASSDNVGVTGYRIYQGSTLVQTLSGSTLEYVVQGLAPQTTYSFTVHAIDAANNQSAGSTISAATSAAPSASPWAANTSYTTGTKVTYNGILYECRQSHTSLVGWEPPNVLALWLPI